MLSGPERFQLRMLGNVAGPQGYVVEAATASKPQRQGLRPAAELAGAARLTGRTDN
jgi:hypothetical protein